MPLIAVCLYLAKCSKRLMDMNRSKSCKICIRTCIRTWVVSHHHHAYESITLHATLYSYLSESIGYSCCSERVHKYEYFKSSSTYIGLKWLLRLVNRWQQSEAPWKWINGTAQCRRMAKRNEVVRYEYNKRRGRKTGKSKKKERFQMRLMSAIDECNRNDVCMCEFHFMLAHIQIHAQAWVQIHALEYIVCYCTCTAECMHWMHDLNK